MTCTHPKSKITESRYCANIILGGGIGRIPITAKRRSHECCDCGERWTTYELTADALRSLFAHKREAQDLRRHLQRIQESIQVLVTPYA